MTMHHPTFDQLIPGALASSAVIGVAFAAAALLCVPAALTAQSHISGDHEPHLYAAADFGIDPMGVTFTKDIAPILARSCVNCHRVGGAGPMPLTSYQEVRRYAGRIKTKTAIRDRMGTMPPWYVEKDLGIQQFKQDPSLTDEDLAMIQAWADNGAPEGDPADLAVELNPRTEDGWRIKPDLIVSSAEFVVEGGAADWWGEIEPFDVVGLEQARWVKAVQHLRDEGMLEGSPRDIGILMFEVKRDIVSEETEWILDRLQKAFFPKILRGLGHGLPEWYKARLVNEAIDDSAEVMRAEIKEITDEDRALLDKLAKT